MAPSCKTIFIIYFLLSIANIYEELKKRNIILPNVLNMSTDLCMYVHTCTCGMCVIHETLRIGILSKEIYEY